MNEGPKSVGQIRRQLPEKSEGMDNLVSAGMPPDGRVPIVAMKRDNTRGAKGNRILVKSTNQREGKTSQERGLSTSQIGTTSQGCGPPSPWKSPMSVRRAVCDESCSHGSESAWGKQPTPVGDAPSFDSIRKQCQ